MMRTELETGCVPGSEGTFSAERPPAVTTEVYRDFESCRGLAAEWDAFVERVSGDIFLTFDWCRIWWDYYGEGRTLRIFLFRKGRRIVGLMPMFLETVRLWPVSLRRVKLVGSDCTAAQFCPAIEAGYLEPVLRSLLSDLKTTGFDQVLLGPIAGRYSRYGDLLAALREAGGSRYAVSVDANEVQIYYRLAATYEQWLGSLKRNHRKAILRSFRKLETHALTCQYETASEDTWEAMFEDFVQLHQAYWNRRGKQGHFPKGSRSQRFFREMARVQLACGRLRLVCLRCGDGSRAYNYNFHCGDTCFEILSARTLSSPQGVSVSRLLHAHTVQQALADSAAWIDSMQGMYDYKIQLGGTPYPVRRICLNRDDPVGRFRIRLFRLAARMLHLFYYQIYYYRLAAKLYGHRRKEPWRLWRRICG